MSTPFGFNINSTIQLISNQHPSLTTASGKPIPLYTKGKIVGIRYVPSDTERSYLVDFKNYGVRTHVQESWIEKGRELKKDIIKIATVLRELHIKFSIVETEGHQYLSTDKYVILYKKDCFEVYDKKEDLQNYLYSTKRISNLKKYLNNRK